MKVGISLPVRELRNDIGAIRAVAQCAVGLGLGLAICACPTGCCVVMAGTCTNR